MVKAILALCAVATAYRLPSVGPHAARRAMYSMMLGDEIFADACMHLPYDELPGMAPALVGGEMQLQELVCTWIVSTASHRTPSDVVLGSRFCRRMTPSRARKSSLVQTVRCRSVPLTARSPLITAACGSAAGITSRW